MSVKPVTAMRRARPWNPIRAVIDPYTYIYFFPERVSRADRLSADLCKDDDAGAGHRQPPVANPRLDPAADPCFS